MTEWTVAAGLGLWIFGYKMLCFLGLETTSDLYSCVQLATSWIRGDFLYDNFFGNQLATHTFLIAPFLGVLAWPFGAVGLFLAVGLAFASTFLALVRLLRLLQVPVTSPSSAPSSSARCLWPCTPIRTSSTDFTTSSSSRRWPFG